MSPIATFLLVLVVMLLAAAPLARRPRGACADASPGCAACALSGQDADRG